MSTNRHEKIQQLKSERKMTSNTSEIRLDNGEEKLPERMKLRVRVPENV